MWRWTAVVFKVWLWGAAALGVLRKYGSSDVSPDPWPRTQPPPHSTVLTEPSRSF
jgi:hypothetical protein